MQDSPPGRKAKQDAPGSSKNDDKARATELMVSVVLRSGVFISAAVIAFGILLLVAHGLKGVGNDLGAVGNYPHAFGQVFSGVARLDPISVITLGLLLVILTPVTRVAVSIVAFAMEKDWRYVVITAVVLFVLVVSFALGKAGS